MGLLTGQVALVTGASRGIGKGIALVLAEQGATVYITGRTLSSGASPLPGSLRETASEMERRGGKGIAVQVDHGEDGIKCFALHPGGVATELGLNMPEAMHAYLIDTPDLAAAFVVWLCSGKADWVKGRYLSATWDVDELTALREGILRDDLLVNRLRAKA